MSDFRDFVLTEHGTEIPKHQSSGDVSQVD